MIKKSFMAIFLSLFCFIGMAFQIQAERMYELDNRMVNGDFYIDTNSDGLANDFLNSYLSTLSTFSIVDGKQKCTSTGLSTTMGFYQAQSFIPNHHYYIKTSWDSIVNSNLYQKFLISGHGYQTIYLSKTKDYEFSKIFISSTNGTEINFILSTETASKLSAGDWFSLDNVLLIDLTLAFGNGFEPSLSDFETLYLPDIDYFDEYTSFDPSNYIQLTTTDYTNLSSDLTGLDYTKSVIDTYGDNMDVSIMMYVYDSGPVSQWYNEGYYITNNHPVICYLGSCEDLSWIAVDYSQYVLELSMTDEQKDKLKKILFNRSIDVANEYFQFDIMATAASYTKVWIALSSAFDLRVDIQSILVSRDIYTENAFNMVQSMIFKAYDKYNNIILPALKMTVGDIFETRLIDDFGSQYTDVSRFNIEFEYDSPDQDDTYPLENTYLYELGCFSSDKIIQPGYYDGDLEQIFTPQTCEWYELGCQATNTVNSIVNSIWVFLDIDAIIETFDGIFTSVNTFVNILPDPLVAIVIIIVSGASIGLIFIIVDRL